VTGTPAIGLDKRPVREARRAQGDRVDSGVFRWFAFVRALFVQALFVQALFVQALAIA